MNPLLELKRLGQSIWYDNLRKTLVTSGELKRMSEEYAVTGVSYNPGAFEKAIIGTTEYDEEILRLMAVGLPDEGILKRLVTKVARLAADVMAAIYKDTRGLDGFVSVEADPGLSTDAASMIQEARRLFDAVERHNVMVKVPATREGLKALEALTFEGLCVNVTLLFSVERYEEAAWAYIRGLEKRLAEGMPIDNISSVASMFVSRVDSLFDRILEERISRSRSNDEKARLKGLLGRVAAANAKGAYMKFQEVYSSERFRRLKDAGARPQRLLWASIGTKNPRYPDTKYIEELVQGGTVSAMPIHTLLAFYDHGKARPTLTEDLDGALKVFSELEALGIDYQAATLRLEKEGVAAYSDSYMAILRAIAEKREAIGMKKAAPVRYSLNGFESAVGEALDEVANENFLPRLWAKDPTLWKSAPDEKKLIKDALGWVALTQVMDDHVGEIEEFASEVKEAGFTDVVLLGMGGSSLAPLVFAESFGPTPGYPKLTVLDSTDPEALGAVDRAIDLAKTLFIVSSKSGSTIEPLSLFEFFHAKLLAIKGEAAGRNFIAITDPGTALEGFSRKFRFRKLFTNPRDIGGRFSALSYFGLVPAALMGVQVSRLLDYASRVQMSLDPCAAGDENPVLMLGAALGTLGRLGRDKLTFFISSGISSFGMWIEQLIAESTGKEGKGLVPVVGEPLGAPADYGHDRVFISITLGDEDEKLAKAMKSFAGAGHPVIDLRLADAYELGGEFLRWEAATAVAGQILGINPFDQPDVELAKKLTIARLSGIGKPGALKPPGVGAESNGFGVYFGRQTFEMLHPADNDVKKMLRDFLGLVREGDYIGLLAYYNPVDRGFEAEFTELRKALRDSTGAATQFGFGPRYLHSTGQLHKGGPKNGLFIILCHAPREDFKVPGSPFSFSDLELSQAYGDMEALDSKGLRVVLVGLKDPSIDSLKDFERLIKSEIS
ncbi:MAG TPA: transaldolase [Deltaproteobacteria bacterium]|nr:MAG: transaldolase [Deltaproteobacteria bacterium GWA2_55_82]OGQ62315.1 MAG: transaldolase [Deltaproteobacteria bacterium RIFCSPLOWO2_02_FULL_55_12]OIJ74427.1 MAG: transaldolase [Deltaproteobacteria bacterium GWC2_55_46]HBG47080.1 transaldolase [Deltaproteobacteria bacterium]HCY10861.1 transaldolase [Deltaproteobacteria bacterium]